MDKPSNKPVKNKVPHSDACDFYHQGFGTHSSGCGQINVTNRPPQFGVFFDGSGNNLTNDTARTDDNKEPTNVSKLYLIYPQKDEHFISKAYIPGVGTTANRDDSDLDLAFAFDFGDKVRKALADTQNFFNIEKFRKAPIGILDVFGFSRGAAAARHFVNEVHRLNKQDPTHFGGPQLHVRFLGLFDTVGSIGVPGDDSQKLPNGEEFNLFVNPNAAQYVYHLTARHEQRAYFPLSSILTDAGQSPAAHFEEVELLGAHSDVGGGYGPVPDVVYYPVPDVVDSSSHADRDAKIRKLKGEYEQKYHEPGVDIRFHVLSEQSMGSWTYTTLNPQWQRPVQTQLAHAALHKMHAKAQEKGVPLEPLVILMQKEQFHSYHPEDAYVIPSDLQDHLSRHESDPQNERIVEYVYKHYIHHSFQYRAKASYGINSNKVQENPHHKAPNEKRDVIYNKPSQGYSPNDQWKRIATGRTTGRWVRN